MNGSPTDWLPAIFLKQAQAVQILPGEREISAVFAGQPCGMARRFIRQGAEWIHVVDWDGEETGTISRVNWIELEALVQQGHVQYSISGGITREEQILKFLELGVDRCVLAPACLDDEKFVSRMIRRYGDKLGLEIPDSCSRKQYETLRNSGAVHFVLRQKPGETPGNLSQFPGVQFLSCHWPNRD
jgi:phosphoribosylformimino-5-aminoimidazole carboxamide ribonucleotide (ProFAR) isomerase